MNENELVILMSQVATNIYSFCSVGRPKHVRVMAGALEGEYFVGPKAEVVYYCKCMFVNSLGAEVD